MMAALVAVLLCLAPAAAGKKPGRGHPHRAKLACFELEATIVGTPGDDHLVGTSVTDVIVGLGGDDRIVGGDDDDSICGGEGDDFVTAGGGNDRIAGGHGSDEISARRGDDQVSGGPGADRVDGGPGDDGCVLDADPNLLLGCDWPLPDTPAASGGPSPAPPTDEAALPGRGTRPVKVDGANKVDAPAEEQAPEPPPVEPPAEPPVSEPPPAEPPVSEPPPAEPPASEPPPAEPPVSEPPVSEPPVSEPPPVEPPPAEPPVVEPPPVEPPPAEPPVSEPPPVEPPVDPCSATLPPGGWPLGCWRPYSDSSPFNQPLPASPRLDADSGAMVSRLLGWGDAQGLIVGQPEGNRDDYGHPVYYGSPNDPRYTIHCTEWTGSCDIDGMTVRIPAAARSASGSDSHMVVIDQEAGWEYDFWQLQTQPLPAGGGTIDVSHGGRTRWGTADATGLGSNATAAHFGLAAGTIRAEEWDRATTAAAPIEHALFMSVRCTGGAAVYPAAAGTTGLSCSSPEADAPPLGAHFYLDLSDAEIDALPVPAWKKPILLAMAHYGLFVGDTFGGTSNSFGLAAESDTQYRALGMAPRYAALGKKWDVGTWNGAYVFDIASGVDWANDLKVVDSCVSAGTC